MIINWIVISPKTTLKNCTNSRPNSCPKPVRTYGPISTIPSREITFCSIFSTIIIAGFIPTTRTIPFWRINSTKVSATTNDDEVSELLSSSTSSSTKLPSLALEEYENLKRQPDPRQLAAQRLHQQQLASAPMVQMPHLQQMYLEFFRSLSAEDQQTFDYSKMLQYAYELGLGPPATGAQKSSRPRSSSCPQGYDGICF